MKVISANRIAPDWTPHFAASHLGLFCLPMSYQKDTGFIWVKIFNTLLINDIFSVMLIYKKSTFFKSGVGLFCYMYQKGALIIENVGGKKK